MILNLVPKLYMGHKKINQIPIPPLLNRDI